MFIFFLKSCFYTRFSHVHCWIMLEISHLARSTSISANSVGWFLSSDLPLKKKCQLGPLPSGKLTFCYGKSPFLMGKPTISMVIFNSYVTNYHRVSRSKLWKWNIFDSPTSKSSSLPSLPLIIYTGYFTDDKWYPAVTVSTHHFGI